MSSVTPCSVLIHALYTNASCRYCFKDISLILAINTWIKSATAAATAAAVDKLTHALGAVGGPP